jgi:hypothetical protein
MGLHEGGFEVIEKMEGLGFVLLPARQQELNMELWRAIEAFVTVKIQALDLELMIFKFT